MRKLATLAVMAILALAFALPAGATIIINLNGDLAVDHSNEVTSDAVMLALGPGTYEVTFTKGEYTAFNRWSRQTGCDNGKNCSRGWENSAYIQIDSDWAGRHLLGIGGGVGPIADGGYFETATASFQNAAQYLYQFTLTAAQNVYFYIGDDNLRDNNGGVSLLVRSVPAPAGWLLSLAGFGMIGLLLARRRKVGTPLAS